MYRQGLGDCFLVTLPTDGDQPYYVVIDCGVILGTQDATNKMQAVVDDIAKTTNSHVNLLIATHEHWDHLSGFLQATDLFGKIQFDNVWLGWTEDPADTLAGKLKAEHQAMRVALQAACARMRAAGRQGSDTESFLEFFGAAGSGTTGDALQIVKGLKPPRFCTPSDAPVLLDGTQVTAYVLGPPHDEQMIKRYNPSKAHPETYGLALDDLQSVFCDEDRVAPFDPLFKIPYEVAKQMPFFGSRYWGEAAGTQESPAPAATLTCHPTGNDGHGESSKRTITAELDQSWRRIDDAWLDASSGMALQLDSATNNTSLVVAFELNNKDVLLFAADAQVGNWLSWQGLKWKRNGDEVTGPDLLQRTVLYKVGHHGSHNATHREEGLELMGKLRIALIPVDHAMAVKKRWGQMPLEQLESRLNDKTGGRVLRVDKPIPQPLATSVTDGGGQLYYEVVL
jgi:hypothetical protein